MIYIIIMKQKGFGSKTETLFTLMHRTLYIEALQLKVVAKESV